MQSRQLMVLRHELAAALPTSAAFLADRERRLMVVRAYVYAPPLQSLVEQLRGQGRTVEAADQPAAIRAFKAGRADALILGSNSLAVLRARDPAFNAAHAALDYAPGNVTIGALAMSRQRISAEDRALLRRTLEDMVREGFVEDARLRHLGDMVDSP